MCYCLYVLTLQPCINFKVFYINGYIDDDCQVKELAQDWLRIANEKQCIHSSYPIPRMASQSEQAGCKTVSVIYSIRVLLMPMQIAYLHNDNYKRTLTIRDPSGNNVGHWN